MVTGFSKSWLFIMVDTQVTSRGGGVSKKNLLEIVLIRWKNTEKY